RDKYDKKLLNADEVVQEAKDGDDIVLTIDQKIQTLLEDVLSQVNDQYQPKRITAVVMDPKTGEVLAMSNRPSYNPNKPNDVKNWYNNHIIIPVFYVIRFIWIKTGEVLAMSNRPSYNPNKPNDVKNWYNDVISTPVEPGSTAKIFTWAAAIDSGV